ncbi:MAG: hypothetical protein HQL31_00830 [Planctomycetes bacterium]|nr:hypothetical protein [Planctomycetota bacterium]
MKERRNTYILMIILCVLSLACVSARWITRLQSHLSHGDKTWRLILELTGLEKSGGNELDFYIPGDSGHCRIFRRSWNSKGFRSGLSTSDIHRNTLLHLIPVASEDRQFKAEVDVLMKFGEGSVERTEGELSTLERAACLAAKKGIQTGDPTVVSNSSALAMGCDNKTQQLSAIFDFCHNDLPPSSDRGFDDAAATLRTLAPSPLGRARTMVALCRAAGIPSRLVSGVELGGSSSAPLLHWIEAFTDEQWTTWDPERGYARKLPPQYLAIRRAGGRLLDGGVDSPVRVRMKVIPLSPPPGLESIGKSWRWLDLTRLPLSSQATLTLILLLPVCALLTALVRNIAGIMTFGTFAPMLLAVSFLYSDWISGVVLFISILVSGFASRRWIDRLKILMVPRMSILLTLVVIITVYGISFFDSIGLTSSQGAVLLPIVIVATLIERIYISNEEDGSTHTFKMAMGSLFMAGICLLVIRSEFLKHIIIVYPELHGLTVAALLGVGRYSGYRLTELWRFRDLVGLMKQRARERDVQ